MNRLLWQHKADLAGVIIRLAWRAGLKRDEMRSLQWRQVDFAQAALRLDDRAAPLESEVAEALRRWRDALTEKSVPLDYVLTSPRTRARPTPALITNTAQRAMEKAGIGKLRLEDLRLDFIRRMRDEHGDRYAMRVSGVNAARYCAILGLDPGEVAARTADGGADYGERLWNLLLQSREGPAAIALWLSQQSFLKNKEIVSLTWDDVDLDRGVVTLDGDTRYLIKEAIAMLRREKDARGADDDPHVILTPTTRAPMGEAQLSAMLRDLLIQNGLGDVHIGGVRSREAEERELRQIRRFVAENGVITRRDAIQKLGIRDWAAYARLRRLVDDGELVLTGKGYVPKERFIPPEAREAAVLALIEQEGYATIAAAAQRLLIGKAAARDLLLSMAARGTVVAAGNHRKFLLPTDKSN